MNDEQDKRREFSRCPCCGTPQKATGPEWDARARTFLDALIATERELQGDRDVLDVDTWIALQVMRHRLHAGEYRVRLPKPDDGPVIQARAAGQGAWFDYIRRRFPTGVVVCWNSALWSVHADAFVFLGRAPKGCGT